MSDSSGSRPRPKPTIAQLIAAEAQPTVDAYGSGSGQTPALSSGICPAAWVGDARDRSEAATPDQVQAAFEATVMAAAEGAVAVVAATKERAATVEITLRCTPETADRLQQDLAKHETAFLVSSRNVD